MGGGGIPPEASNRKVNRMDQDERIRVGISSCLLGQAVRYDGGHKLSALCASKLAREFTFVPVCPEVGIGMGVPRKPIHLVGNVEAPRAVGVAEPDLDVTAALRAFATRKAAELQGLSGYIFIRNSPSCGLYGVKVLADGGGAREQGRGIYAAELLRRLPWLPVEEAGRLEEDAALRARFLARVRACHQWQRLAARGVTADHPEAPADPGFLAFLQARAEARKAD